MRQAVLKVSYLKVDSRLALFELFLWKDVPKRIYTTTMKKERVTYRISEPCHENWERMTPNEKGRFCDSCAKPVVDFTNMSNRQIHRTMEESRESVCGRMTISQVNREMNFNQVTQPSFSLRALVLGTALSTFSAVQSCAQTGKVEPTEQTVKGEVVEEPILMGDIEPVKYEKVSGKVTDYLQKSLIAGTSVTIYDEGGKELSTTLVNEKGEFELMLDYSQDPYRMVFRCKNYVEQSYLIDELSSRTDMIVILYHKEQVIMGKVVADPRK